MATRHDSGALHALRLFSGRAVLLGLLALLLLVPAAGLACGGNDDTDGAYGGGGDEPNTTAAETEGATVDMEGTAFVPDEITVSAGETVTWVNNDPVAHTVTAEDDGFDSGDLGEGETFSHTFADPGTYPYVCTIHPGMTGTVIVE